MKTYRQTSIKQTLQLRAKVIQAVRNFFTKQDYLEIETPCRIPAPAPEAHIDAEVSGKWFLQTSPEICMKRLIAAGYPRIFQICKCFRHRERGRLHLPEFTMLEWYTAGSNYLKMMDQCEDMIRHVAAALGLKDTLKYQDDIVDLKKPWQRMSVSEAFDKFTASSMESAVAEDRFDEVMAFYIEPNLGRQGPLFLFDYPAQGSALARVKPGDPSLVERFELYISGLELCNAFTELTDPDEQIMRFEEEQQRRRDTDKQMYPTPEKFLEALKQMPEAAGNALGIDRLIMLFANTTKIEDVVAFTPDEL